MRARTTIYPAAVADMSVLLDMVSRERITMLPGTPTLFYSILNHPERDTYDLSSLRLSAIGAASVPVDLVKRMQDELFETVVTGYGLTETTGVSTMSRFDDSPEIISRTVGRALPDVAIRIVDTTGKDVDTGVAGEVLVRGYNVMKGYFEDPEQTAEAIDAEGWLHTGDVGTLDDAGYLAITGPAEGHVHRRRFQCVPGGDRSRPAAPPCIRHGRRDRDSRRADGRGRDGVRRAEARGLDDRRRDHRAGRTTRWQTTKCRVGSPSSRPCR